MPLSHEVVPNRDITGPEAKKLIVGDVTTMLDADGVFSDHIAFSELAYKVTVEVHMNNPTYPVHTSVVYSRPKPEQPVAIKPFPLAQEIVESKDDVTGEVVPEEKVVGIAKSRTRKVTNPNKERVKRGMPVTIIATDPKTGRPTEAQVKYDPASLDPTELDTNIGAEDTDVTESKRKDWKWGDK